MFYKLESAKLEKVKDGACLDTLLLEEEMQKYNGGVYLSKIRYGEAHGNEEQCKKFVPFFTNRDDLRKEEDVLRVVNKHEEQKEPCAMIVNSIDELAEHMSNAYQVSHFHYILGMKYGFSGFFPQNACGQSSRNLMIALIDHGYKNAAIASSSADHGYIVLPFVLTQDEKDIKGSIVVDPTSDQLGIERNAVFIKIGNWWQYRTRWRRHPGKNLFPDLLASIEVIRKNVDSLLDPKYHHKYPKIFFDKAFSNPVEIEIKEN